MRDRKGFTLIELLVVIAIIALLLSIIAPALRKAKESVWNVICRNNLRNYGLAGMAYTQENAAIFPNAWGSIYKSINDARPRECQFHDESKNPLKRPELAGKLWNYLGDQDKSHLCPLFDRFAHTNHVCTQPGLIPMEPIFGYSMNAMLGGFEFGGAAGGVYTHVLVVKVNEIHSPANIFFFGEENPWTDAVTANRYSATLNDNALCGAPEHPSKAAAWDGYSLNYSGKLLDSLASFHKTTFDKRNDGESNVVFIDGHVDMANWKDTYRLSRWTNKMPTLRK
ncbi:MAG: type II secretion system GspH family protein [Planctomycetaceae bacterium]|nr:type II secretion system GspH family protein [Planctomycetaceae bacterium]